MPEPRKPSPFASRVLHALRAEVVVNPGGTQPLRVQVDRLEIGPTSFREDFSVRFRLTDAPPQWTPEAVEVSDGPIGVTEPIDSRQSLGVDTCYFFRFRKGWGLEGSMDRFRAFVRDRLDGESSGRGEP